MVNFYRCFISIVAGILQSLELMLSPHKTSGKTINWDHDTKFAFSTIKKIALRMVGIIFTLLKAG